MGNIAHVLQRIIAVLIWCILKTLILSDDFFEVTLPIPTAANCLEKKLSNGTIPQVTTSGAPNWENTLMSKLDLKQLEYGSNITKYFSLQRNNIKFQPFPS